MSDTLFKFSKLRRTFPTASNCQREGFGHFRRLLSISEKVSDTPDGFFLSARGFRTLPTASICQREGFGHSRRALSISGKVSDTSDDFSLPTKLLLDSVLAHFCSNAKLVGIKSLHGIVSLS